MGHVYFWYRIKVFKRIEYRRMGLICCSFARNMALIVTNLWFYFGTSCHVEMFDWKANWLVVSNIWIIFHNIWQYMG